MIPLEPDKYYHIYNRANGDDQLFREEKNFHFFLNKYNQYISPISHTLAYCLMPNHFHFLVRIKSMEEIMEATFPKLNQQHNQQALNKNLPGTNTTFPKLNQRHNQQTFPKSRTLEKGATLEKFISKKFSNLFSSYTQAYNKHYSRKGSLFIKNFNRKLITSNDYLVNAIKYTHLNPVSHGFVDKPEDWIYSSYNSIISNKTTNIAKLEVVNLYDDIENFICPGNY